MAAVTVTNKQYSVQGNKVCLYASLSSVDNADTWATGFQSIDNFDFAPTTAGAGTQWGATISGGTVTFLVESGTLAGLAKVEGVG